jgi:hypothetical protein
VKSAGTVGAGRPAEPVAEAGDDPIAALRRSADDWTVEHGGEPAPALAQAERPGHCGHATLDPAILVDQLELAHAIGMGQGRETLQHTGLLERERGDGVAHHPVESPNFPPAEPAMTVVQEEGHQLDHTRAGGVPGPVAGGLIRGAAEVEVIDSIRRFERRDEPGRAEQKCTGRSAPVGTSAPGRADRFKGGRA